VIGLGVKVEKPRGKRGPLKLETSALATATAVARGRKVKRRVARDGKPVDSFRGYKSGGKVYVAQKYAEQADAPAPVGGGKGLAIYESSAVMHARTKRGSFKTTGGMWDGLSAQPKGRGRATLTFRGRSTGSDLFAVGGRGDVAAGRRQRKRARFASGKTLRPIKVSNALKASTVAERSQVNVLRMTRSEDQGTADGIAEVIGKSVHASLGGRRTRGRSRRFGPRGDTEIARDIVNLSGRNSAVRKL